MNLERQFGSEATRSDCLAAWRWPQGFRCPGSGTDQLCRTQCGLRSCCGCSRQTSVTTGTISGDANLALNVWVQAVRHLVTQKEGASAPGLQQVALLGSYYTAWMVIPGPARLCGTVEGLGGLLMGTRPQARTTTLDQGSS